MRSAVSNNSRSAAIIVLVTRFLIGWERLSAAMLPHGYTGQNRDEVFVFLSLPNVVYGTTVQYWNQICGIVYGKGLSLFCSSLNQWYTVVIAAVSKVL